MRFLMKWFPIKARSFNEFVELAGQHRSRSIRGSCSMEGTWRGGETSSVGRIDNYHYVVILEAEALHGRVIVFREVCQVRFGSDRGFSDAEERGKAAIRALITAYDRLRRAQENLPGVDGILVGARGALDEKTLQRLVGDAAKFNIEPVSMAS